MKIPTNRVKKLIGAISSLVAVSAVTTSATAQGWEAILTYRYADGYALAADALGNVFSGGGTTGADQGLVLKSDTTENTWTLSDNTDPSRGNDVSEVYSLGFDSNGNLYSVGQIIQIGAGGADQFFWCVRKSADRGLTWTTVDLYQYPGGSWIDATGFTADDSGNIYVEGGASDASGNRHWLVRKSADGGATWELVDDMIGNLASEGAFVPGIGIFVVGDQGDVGWTVRRSLDGGATWETVDAPFSSGAGAWSVASDSLGNIYVVGSHSVATTTTTRGKPTVTYSPSVWVTRESKDGGNTWATVDTYTLAQNEAAVGHGLGTTAAGTVVAVGQAGDAGGKHVNSSTHWIARSPSSAGSWQTVDNFQLTGEYHNAAAYSVVTDAAGNLLVTGYAESSNGTYWVVRKLP